MDRVTSGNHPIIQETRSLISRRYKRMTLAVNREFWGTESDAANTLYVGSYGRGTAISTSDLDILASLPRSEYERFDAYSGNGQSRLLQALKDSVRSTWPSTDIHADGQVVVVRFSDGMRFEILPAFEQSSPWQSDVTYAYPDSNMGGSWLSTNPKAEQDAMREKNTSSRGLLFDTCKHIRYVHMEHFSSYHLSGILIDSFVSKAIGGWRWCEAGESSSPAGAYEQQLLDYYDQSISAGYTTLYAPGSRMTVSTKDSTCLRKVLSWMAQ